MSNTKSTATCSAAEGKNSPFTRKMEKGRVEQSLCHILLQKATLYFALEWPEENKMWLAVTPSFISSFHLFLSIWQAINPHHPMIQQSDWEAWADCYTHAHEITTFDGGRSCLTLEHSLQPHQHHNPMGGNHVSVVGFMTSYIRVFLFFSCIPRCTGEYSI